MVLILGKGDADFPKVGSHSVVTTDSTRYWPFSASRLSALKICTNYGSSARVSTSL